MATPFSTETTPPHADTTPIPVRGAGYDLATVMGKGLQGRMHAMLRRYRRFHAGLYTKPEAFGCDACEAAKAEWQSAYDAVDVRMDELDDLASRRERITQTILFWAAYLAGLQSIKDLGPFVGKAALLRRVADWIMAIPEVIRS